MRHRPEPSEKAAHRPRIIGLQQYQRIQFGQTNARPEQGDRQQRQQQAWRCRRVALILSQHRGVQGVSDTSGAG